MIRITDYQKFPAFIESASAPGSLAEHVETGMDEALRKAALSKEEAKPYQLSEKNNEINQKTFCDGIMREIIFETVFFNQDNDEEALF